METTGGDASCLNGNNEIHNRNIRNIVISGILDINHHENKCCCASETSAEVHSCRINSALDKISPHFTLYGKIPSIYELRTFGCDIYPITSSPKKLDERTQAGSFMGYTNSRSAMKLWEPHTRRLNYCSSAKFDEHKN